VATDRNWQVERRREIKYFQQYEHLDAIVRDNPTLRSGIVSETCPNGRLTAGRQPRVRD
jgi:hypothetical protein